MMPSRGSALRLGPWTSLRPNPLTGPVWEAARPSGVSVAVCGEAASDPLGMPLLLGSWWGLVIVPLIAAGMGMRAIGEERMLRRELSGYDEYARRVRFRLIPGIW